jgi:hypothetical protein
MHIPSDEDLGYIASYPPCHKLTRDCQIRLAPSLLYGNPMLVSLIIPIREWSVGWQPGKLAVLTLGRLVLRGNAASHVYA